MYQLFIIIEEEGYERFFRSYGVESFRNLPILSNSSIICILGLRGIILCNLGTNIYSNGPVLSAACCLLTPPGPSSSMSSHVAKTAGSILDINSPTCLVL